MTRLAEVLALDVSGSIAERRLELLQLFVLSLLAVPMVITLVMFANIDLKATETADELIRKGITTVNVVSIIIICVVLAATSTWFHASKRRFVWAAVVTGFVGCLGTFW